MDYSKEEILEMIERTKEKYHISDMYALGVILGDYSHNWYYYYKKHAKKSPDFLEALLAVQEPNVMFEKLKAAADHLMKKKNMEKGDIKKLLRYAGSMSSCIQLMGEQFREDLQKGAEKAASLQEPNDKSSCLNAVLDQAQQNLKHFMISNAYVVQLLFYFTEWQMKRAKEGINARNKGKENFDLKACYDAHCNTPEFELSRRKNPSKEEEKAACWYKIRCNNIKLCKIYEYSQKIKALNIEREEVNERFENASDSLCIQEEYITIFKDVCELLQEVELLEV